MQWFSISLQVVESHKLNTDDGPNKTTIDESNANSDQKNGENVSDCSSSIDLNFTLENAGEAIVNEEDGVMVAPSTPL